MGVLRVGVLGAGVVGLNTALELQREFPTADFTLVADKFNTDTTSDGAAGLFEPAPSFSGPNLQTTRQWISDSYKFYDDIRMTDADAGIFQQSGFLLSNMDPDMVRNHLLEGVVPVYRAATPEELAEQPCSWKYGSFFTTLIIECRSFLPWAIARFTQAGGKVLQKSVSSFQEVASEFEVVVNCTGLGASKLCQDYMLTPIRGQVIKVKAPWLNTFTLGDYDAYVIPGLQTVTVGGCWHYGSYDLRVSPTDKAVIKSRCEAMVPSLVRAEFVRDWVGLRPHRGTVRVEAETCHGVKLVHNYGHGGYGVTSAPGTAKHATRLLRQQLSASLGSAVSKL